MVAGSVFKRCGCRDAVTGRLVGRRFALLPVERHGSWYFSVELAASAGGRRRRLRRGGFASQSAAQAALARFADPVDGAVEAGLTVRVWLCRWLASRHALRPETHRSYGELIGNYLVPYLGPTLLSQVRTGDVQDMFVSIIRRHEQAGRPLIPATMQRIYATARAAFNAAVRAGLIEVSPARGVELPPVRAARAVVWTDERVAAWRRDGVRPVVAVWTAAQTAAVLRCARPDRWYTVFHLIELSGLRRGEACGLRWADLDLEHGTLSVTRQVQRRGGRLVELAPKSAAGTRTLALAAGADLKVVSAMPGHASIQTTADTYTSVLPQTARDAAERTAHAAVRHAAPCRPARLAGAPRPPNVMRRRAAGDVRHTQPAGPGRASPGMVPQLLADSRRSVVCMASRRGGDDEHRPEQ